MKIDLMKPSDYEAVKLLWSKTDGMGLRTLDDSKKGIHKFLMRNPKTNFICKEEHYVIGVMMCGHDGRRGYIYHAAVDESHRGKGIGKALLDHITTALIEEGINKVALVAYEHNFKGNAFWESQGFIKRNDLVYRNKAINKNNL